MVSPMDGSGLSEPGSFAPQVAADLPHQVAVLALGLHEHQVGAVHREGPGDATLAVLAGSDHDPPPAARCPVATDARVETVTGTQPKWAAMR